MQHAHIIDISAVFFRYYFSPSPEIFNDDEYEVSTLISSVRWLCDARFFSLNVTVVAFDESLGTGVRHQIDEDYKANRAMPTEDIIYQLACLQQVASMLGFVVLKSSQHEADDLIASAVSVLKDYDCVIHSRDKDLRQLLCEHVEMMDVQTNKTWDVNTLWENTQLQPKQIPDYLALMGDASDNIIGVPGIGDKTARKLLNQFPSWPALLEAVQAGVELDARGAKRLAGLIVEYQELVEHNLRLTKLVHDIEVCAELEAVQTFSRESYDALLLFCQNIGVFEKLKKPLAKLEGFL